ncbi:WD repeat-containing protein 74 isoform X1 [Poecile atricapillus]|uniref:WD repeat-containing protein 74 isoform X1 n=1 Tax=Poecile atricapillus TaxID=48891 RepID=UPI002739916D|nr:WD repeat-containing protein 74 isoform X1 [Poecile atricapillus]
MAAPTRLFHVWVGAETGALKGVNLQRKEASNHAGGSGLSRARGVSALAWGDPAQTELLVACLDRSLSVFSTEKGKFTGSRRCPGGDGAFCGLGVLGSSVVTAVESGLIRLWGEDEAEEPLQELQAGPGLCRMRQDPARPHVLGTAGKENGLKVWDLQRPGEPLFRAKNVRNDWLDLRVPVWDRDLQFLPGSQRILTCTGHGQLGGRGQRPGGRGRAGSAQRAGAEGSEGFCGGGPGAAVPPPPAPRRLRQPRPIPAPARPERRAAPAQGVPEVAPQLPPAEHTPGLGGPRGAPSPKGEG